MHSLGDLWHQYSDPTALIMWGGYVALTIIIFAETGLLIGFFLPGDSLLVSAGLIAARGTLDVWLMCALLTVAAILGQTVGYAIGKAAGPRLFAREDSLFFKRSHLQRAQAFYEKHGGKTIVLARFMPIVRTFVPVVAGAARMDYRRFQIFNLIGGVL
ncbi:MAG: putative rane protein, partial [Gemmatimonadetes bacterium]|nr:putative rane protein [Gemmatimonadota bacterium]